MTASPPDIIDVTIIGGGPTGLAAAYYAGHREATVRIIDTLPELGGQVMAVYPEKTIYDVAGHASIVGHKLVHLQVQQALQFEPDVVLNENCATLDYVDAPEGEAVDRLIRLTGASGAEYFTRTLIVTAGHGAFRPRKLKIPQIEHWEGNGLSYAVKRIDEFRGQRVVIVGGGDSALDWTLGLNGVAADPIVLVHRRDRFRAIESSVTKMRELVSAGTVDLRVPSEVTAIHGEHKVEAVDVTNRDTESVVTIPCDSLVTLLGFSSALGSIADWGLEFASKKTINVTPGSMETNLPNVFAAGDVAWYEGKITLITVGMGEAAQAANWAITRIRPGAKLQPAYSTE
jgi:thioredoxin reductase (NADPH)